MRPPGPEISSQRGFSLLAQVLDVALSWLSRLLVVIGWLYVSRNCHSIQAVWAVGMQLSISLSCASVCFYKFGADIPLSVIHTFSLSGYLQGLSVFKVDLVAVPTVRTPSNSCWHDWEECSGLHLDVMWTSCHYHPYAHFPDEGMRAQRGQCYHHWGQSQQPDSKTLPSPPHFDPSIRELSERNYEPNKWEDKDKENLSCTPVWYFSPGKVCGKCVTSSLA